MGYKTGEEARIRVFRAKSEAWSEVGIPTSVGERSRNSDLGGKNSGLGGSLPHGVRSTRLPICCILDPTTNAMFTMTIMMQLAVDRALCHPVASARDLPLLHG